MFIESESQLPPHWAGLAAQLHGLVTQACQTACNPGRRKPMHETAVPDFVRHQLTADPTRRIAWGQAMTGLAHEVIEAPAPPAERIDRALQEVGAALEGLARQRAGVDEWRLPPSCIELRPHLVNLWQGTLELTLRRTTALAEALADPLAVCRRLASHEYELRLDVWLPEPAAAAALQDWITPAPSATTVYRKDPLTLDDAVWLAIGIGLWS